MLDDMAPEQIAAFEEGLYNYVNEASPKIVHTITDEKVLPDDVAEELRGLIETYKASFLAGQKEE